MRLLGMLLTASVVLGAVPAGAQVNEQLANVVLQPQTTTDLVALRLMFLTGSINDPKGKEGLTALTAHLMAEGGAGALTAADINEALFPMAAELRVQVDKEMAVFIGRVHRDHLAGFVRIFADVAAHPRFDPKEFERLRRDAIMNIERRLRSSDDEELGKEALESLLYAGHPYGHYVGGTVAGLKKITLDDVKAQWKKVFTEDRLIIGIAGHADLGLARLLKIKLSSLPKQGAKPLDMPAPAWSKVKILIVEKPDAAATAISLGYPYELRRGNPSFYPMMLATSAFGEHRQSIGRLYEALRAQRGLNYGDYAYAEAFRQDGWGTFPLPNVPRRIQQFSIWIRPVEHQNALFALRAALYQTKKLVDGGLSQAEIDRQKGFLDGYTRLWEQTLERRLGNALDELFYRQPNHLGGFRAATKKMSRAAINAAIKKYVRPHALRIAIVTKNGAALRQAILSGKPSPIHYPTPKPKGVLAEDKQIAAFPLRYQPDEIKVVKAQELFAR